MHLVIIVFIPCVYVRRTWYIHFICSASEIVPDNPFGDVILFYSFSSTKLLISICLPSLLYTTLVHSFPLCFCKFFWQFLLIFEADENWWHQLRNFRHRLSSFCKAWFSSVSRTGPFMISKNWTRSECNRERKVNSECRMNDLYWKPCVFTSALISHTSSINQSNNLIL